MNANLDAQTIASGANILFSASPIETTVTGISFNGVNTFTILQSGLYYLNHTLNFAPGTPAQSHFEVLLNASAPRASGSNAGTVGPVSLIRVQNYSTGNTIAITNYSPNPVTIQNALDISGKGEETFSTGHFSFFRFADGPAL